MVELLAGARCVPPRQSAPKSSPRKPAPVTHHMTAHGLWQPEPRPPPSKSVSSTPAPARNRAPQNKPRRPDVTPRSPKSAARAVYAAAYAAAASPVSTGASALEGAAASGGTAAATATSSAAPSPRAGGWAGGEGSGALFELTQEVLKMAGAHDDARRLWLELVLPAVRCLYGWVDLQLQSATKPIVPRPGPSYRGLRGRDGLRC